ncbi:alpha/beta fold hydrolase [Ilumatobacter sp.]|uniref:alpha/beta fold hydrolase n=1 Tax=Ilumatobacter sp. TaxID=1967498 RepID=UPI003C5F7C98
MQLRTGEMVRVQEAGDGPPVLLVHGASNAGTSWMSLMAKLQDFRCIALDRPGCGLSDPIVGGPLRDIDAIESYADRLLTDVLDGLELHRAAVLATSYGGYFAVRGAAANPPRVDRIVEYSWLLGAPMDKVAMSMRLSALPGMRAISAKMPVTRSMVKALLRQIGLERAIDTGTFTDEMIDWFLSVQRDTDTMINDLRSSPKIVTPVRGLNTRILHTDELLARVTMPIMFLWGDEDPNGGELVARSFAARLPDAQLEVIRRAGHAPWIDELDLCAARTRAFLAA